MPASTSTPRAATPLRPLIERELPELIAIRHDLHAHPELGYAERRTAGVIVDELARLGVRSAPGLAGGTGVAAYLPATEPGGAAVALRADMDALPITERTGLPYASTVPGVMHACGHDGHVANLLGVARVLSKIDRRPNAVTLLFQPAEEGGAGGLKMCEDGVLDGAVIGPKIDRVYGLHGWPQLPVGVVASRPGPLLAATDNFRLTIRGTQAHAAYPHLAHDPIVAAAHAVTALQTIASRTVGPLDSVVVTIGTINGGVARNVIPETVSIVGTIRTLTPAVRAAVKARFFEIVEGTAAAMGCRAEIDWQEGYPVTSNDPATTDRFFRIARERLGVARVRTVEHPTMGGEDFSYYGLRAPACFFVLGLMPEGGETMPSLHQPEFDFNDAALATGIETMAALALEG